MRSTGRLFGAELGSRNTFTFRDRDTEWLEQNLQMKFYNTGDRHKIVRGQGKSSETETAAWVAPLLDWPTCFSDG